MSDDPNLLNVDDPNPGGDPPAGDPPKLPEWDSIRSALPEELRDDSSLSTITSLDGLVKGYVHAQRSFGKDKISVPDKHATEDDWKGLFGKLGNPEKLEDYQLSLGDDVKMDEEVLNKVKAVAHSKGILPWQFEAIVKEFNSVAGSMEEAALTEFQAQKEREVNELKETWGKGFDGQVKRANAAMRHFLPEAKDQEAFIKTVGSSNPAALKLLAKASELLKDDDFLGQGDGTSIGMSKAQALEKANTMRADKSHPFNNPSHPNHRAAKQEMMNLYDVAYSAE